jgi:putative CocE/NonD family hydrolase
VPFYEKKKAKLPVIWTHYIYHRASTLPDGTVITQVDMNPWLQEVIKHGYVVGVVDCRGGGASYGARPGSFSQIEARDTYEITEWFAEQKWCNGNIGMFGRSVMGITQYMCAGMAPPHLKCIFPEMSMFDTYSFVYPGGVVHVVLI